MSDGDLNRGRMGGPVQSLLPEAGGLHYVLERY